jgi:glycosyltransferase involved in cell wall biosynthesis
VNLARFRPDAAARQSVRAELAIHDGSRVVLFLGRIRREKGVIDLAEAFGQMPEAPGAVLIFVGPDEEKLKQEIMNRCPHASERLRFVDYTRSPQRYLAASDVLCLPSYREGFGTVVIEAAAVGLPSVASRIYGIIDAVIDGETGLLFEPRNVEDLREKLVEILRNDELRKRLGRAARNRVVAEFAQEKLTAAMASFYEEILSEG